MIGFKSRIASVAGVVVVASVPTGFCGPVSRGSQTEAAAAHSATGTGSCKIKN